MLTRQELLNILPSLVQNPLVFKGWRCRRKLHKWTTWASRKGLTSNAVRICRRCGQVEHGWIAQGGLYSRFECAGYVQPNIQPIFR